jgi:hypothetical protein
MIKVEQDMLVLDSSFTKEDAQAINQFVEIAKRQERDRIVRLLESQLADQKIGMFYADAIGASIKLIKENNETTKDI